MENQSEKVRVEHESTAVKKDSDEIPVPIGLSPRYDSSDTTINRLFDGFLQDQKVRGLSAKTLRKYETMIDCYRMCLDGYGYNSLDDTESARIEADPSTTFCDIFGADKINNKTINEFFGYWLPRKLGATETDLKEATTVLRKLVHWLRVRDLLDPDEVELALGAVDEGLESADLYHELVKEFL